MLQQKKTSLCFVLSSLLVFCNACASAPANAADQFMTALQQQNWTEVSEDISPDTLFESTALGKGSEKVWAYLLTKLRWKIQNTTTRGDYAVVTVTVTSLPVAKAVADFNEQYHQNKEEKQRIEKLPAEQAQEALIALFLTFLSSYTPISERDVLLHLAKQPNGWRVLYCEGLADALLGSP